MLRKPAVLLAISALTAMFLLPGAGTAVAAPEPPTVSSPADGALTNNNAPTFTGTSSALRVRVVIEGDGSSQFFCRNIPVVDGAWSCQTGTQWPDGTYSYSAVDYPGSASRSAIRTLTIDTTPPSASIITAPGVGVGPLVATTENPRPTISGRSEPGSTVTVYRDSSPTACQSGDPVADSNGTWSCTLASALTPGTFIFGTIPTDRAGNRFPGSPAEQLRLTYEPLVPPAFPRITQPFGTIVDGVIQSSTTSTHPVIAGQGEFGASVTVYKNGAPVACVGDVVTVRVLGWSCLLRDGLTPGVHEFSASQLSSNGLGSGTSATQLRLTVIRILPPAPPRPVKPAPTVPSASPTPTPAPSVSPSTAPTPKPAPSVSPSKSPRPSATARPVPTPGPTLPTLGGFLTFSADSTDVELGDTVTLSSTGLPPGSVIEAELHSDPVSLGMTTVKDDGTFTLTAIIPLTVEPGEHHYVVTITPPGQPSVTIEQPVTVRVAATHPEAEPDDEADPGAVAGPAAPGNEAVDDGDRSNTGLPWGWIAGALGITALAGVLYLILRRRARREETFSTEEALSTGLTDTDEGQAVDPAGEENPIEQADEQLADPELADSQTEAEPLAWLAVGADDDPAEHVPVGGPDEAEEDSVEDVEQYEPADQSDADALTGDEEPVAEEEPVEEEGYGGVPDLKKLLEDVPDLATLLQLEDEDESEFESEETPDPDDVPSPEEQAEEPEEDELEPESASPKGTA